MQLAAMPVSSPSGHFGSRYSLASNNTGYSGFSRTRPRKGTFQSFRVGPDWSTKGGHASYARQRRKKDSSVGTAPASSRSRQASRRERKGDRKQLLSQRIRSSEEEDVDDGRYKYFAWYQLPAALLELANLLIPVTFFALAYSGALQLSQQLNYGDLFTIWISPLIYFLFGISLTLLMLLAKKFGPACTGTHPAFGVFYLYWQSVGALVILTESYFLQYIRGTYYFNLVLEFFSGHNVPVDTFWDLPLSFEAENVFIGDGVMCSGSLQHQELGPLLHVMDNGRLQFATVVVDDNASLNAGAVLMPGSTVQAGATVGPNSIALKGETLIEGTYWLGYPARAIRKQTRMEFFSEGKQAFDNDNLRSSSSPFKKMTSPFADRTSPMKKRNPAMAQPLLEEEGFSSDLV